VTYQQTNGVVTLTMLQAQADALLGALGVTPGQWQWVGEMTGVSYATVDGVSTVSMSAENYGKLMALLAQATAASPDQATFNARLQFANDMNAGNSNWTPYVIPS
jgi:hypothetical protein